MKEKKFGVTLIVLSFAVFSILKYCSKICYQLADWELCSHEEDWSPWAQSPMSRSTWDEFFKGSNAAVEVPGYIKESKEVWLGTELEHTSPVAEHGTAKETSVSLSAKCFALSCCCLFWCSWWWQLSKYFLWKHRTVASDAYILLMPHLCMRFTLIALTHPSEEIWGPWVKEQWNLSSFQWCNGKWRSR